MNHQQTILSPALYLVATPIGNARDITLRALDVLASADILAAEDTRTLQKLMQIHGIGRDGRQMVAHHDHSSPQAARALVDHVRDGKAVAYVSEAGTPLVSDPGYALVQSAVDADVDVVAVPGPSAVLAAATVAGMATDRLLFVGFPPSKTAARDAWLRELAPSQTTLVVYESPRRLGEFLGHAKEIFGETRPATLCRELTKKFEEVRRGTLGELHGKVMETPPKGECVMVIGGAPPKETTQADVDQALLNALERSSVKDAVAEVASTLGLARKDVYQRALDLKHKG